MEGIVYHSSQIGGLSELDPSKSKYQATHEKNMYMQLLAKH